MFSQSGGRMTRTLCSPPKVLLCGLDGFSDFYKAEWLQHILRQQDAELGCFGKDSE